MSLTPEQQARLAYLAYRREHTIVVRPHEGVKRNGFYDVLADDQEIGRISYKQGWLIHAPFWGFADSKAGAVEGVIVVHMQILATKKTTPEPQRSDT